MKEYANWKEITKKIANKNEAIAGTQHYVPSGCRLCLDNPSGHNRMLPGCCQDAVRCQDAAGCQDPAGHLRPPEHLRKATRKTPRMPLASRLTPRTLPTTRKTPRTTPATRMTPRTPLASLIWSL